MPSFGLRHLTWLVTLILALAFGCAASAGPLPAPGLTRSGAAGFVEPAGAPCIMIGDKRICLDIEDKGKTPKKQDEQPGEDDVTPGGEQGGQPENKQDGSAETKKTGNICQGEIACPPGYVVLDKPNKYGACCEPKEGFPAPATEKCKFPGEVGTPPNCHCPENTEFVGYKGCVTVGFRCVVKYWEVEPAQDLTYDYTGIGDEITVRGELSKQMDLRNYHAKGPVTCTKVYYK